MNTTSSPESDSAAPSASIPGRALRSHRLKPRRFSLIALSLTVGLVAVTGAVTRDAEPEELELWTVTPALYRETFETRGDVAPLRTERVASNCRWSTRILSIVPEGTWVQEGDVVCELDSSEVLEKLREREVRLIRERAGLETSVQEELIQKTNSERRVAKAEFDLQDAELALQEYESGTWPDQLSQLDGQIQLAEDMLTNAQGDYEFNEYLWVRGQTNSSAFLRSSAELHKDDLEYRTLTGTRDLQTDYVHPRRKMQLEYQKDDARRDLIRTRIATSLAETRARLGTLYDERRVAIYERHVASARKSLEACTLRAPRSGQVIYAQSWYDRSRGRNAIEVGKTVRFQQGVFEIPDSDRFKVSVPLSESLITRVYNGMPADVVLTGFEGEHIVGKVTHIARYPRARSRYMPGVRDYWLDVTLLPNDEQSELLRNQAKAEVTLVLKEQPNALMVPRSAVAGLAGQYFVWRMDGTDLVVQPVELGDIQEDRVVVRDGLQIGDHIAVDPPEQQKAALEKQLTDTAAS